MMANAKLQQQHSANLASNPHLRDCIRRMQSGLACYTEETPEHADYTTALSALRQLIGSNDGTVEHDEPASPPRSAPASVFALAAGSGRDAVTASKLPAAVQDALLAMGVAVYKVGDVYHVDANEQPIPDEDKEKWFVSLPCSSPLARTVGDIPLADTEDQAWQVAATHVGKSSKSTRAQEVFAGYVKFHGNRIQVDFEAPAGASRTAKDAAFLAALAEQAEVNYLSMGVSSENHSPDVKLPAPNEYRDGSSGNAIPLEVDQLPLLGAAHIESVGSENIYVVKDDLHYYCKVMATENYSIGDWDFASHRKGMCQLSLKPSGRFITDAEGRKVAETLQPGSSPAEQEAIKQRLVGSFNALPDLVGVLLRADKEGALWQALYNEGITDAYDEVLSQAVNALGEEGIAQVANRYELNLETIRAKAEGM